MTETRTIELYGRDQIRLAADVMGDETDPPMLLLHGGGQTRHSWRWTQRAVADRGWYTLALDLRGHGDSQWAPDGDYSLDAFSADVVEVARQLARPPVLVGASLGGTSALAALGATHDDPIGTALVLIDVAPVIEPSGVERIRNFMTEHMASGFADLDEVADAIAAYNPHRPRPTDVSGLSKNLRRGEDGRWYWHWDPMFMTSRPTNADETRTIQHRALQLDEACRSLTVPTLLVRGQESDLLAARGVEHFLGLVPHAKYIDVSGAGHMVAGDNNDVFTEAVLEFLEHSLA